MTRTSGTATDRTAIVAITRRGCELGRKLVMLMPGSLLYTPNKFFALGPAERNFPYPRPLVHALFGQYRRLVLIMAAGIAVRMIAPKLKDKRTDPAVVVVDETGKFAVSLVSGHAGGANELARQVASLIGAQPVVTTASDASGQLSIDVVARERGWAVEGDLTRVSAALVNGEVVGVYQDAGDAVKDWPESVTVFSDVEALRQSGSRAAVIVADRICDPLPFPTIICRPKSLVVGIGCNRGTTAAEIDSALSELFGRHGLSRDCIRNLATIESKKDEAGISEFARSHQLPVDYFGKEALAATAFPSPPSALALKHVGVPAVCEAAAILSSGASIIVPKTGFNRKITLAVARLPPVERLGKLILVGIGPGSLEQMTISGRQAIAASQVIVGYRPYIEQVRPLLRGKETVSTGMGKEVERVGKAIELAVSGKIVALISGGDSGVYGLAGLVGEMLKARNRHVDLEVVPGVTAAVAAGALLGAPLNVDVASISLSDHLQPWEGIAKRLEMAARGDFVIALYNPRSKQRQEQLEKARDIIARHRSPETPVGIVTNGYRPGQAVIVTDLAHMLEHDIGMNTTVIIGNSTTVSVNGWMVTPRGYHRKYKLGEK